MDGPTIERREVIGNAYEAAVARYWDMKQSDPINLLLGEEDGIFHHHYGVGDFDHSILGLAPEVREQALLRELHRLENRQTDMVADTFGEMTPDSRILDAGSGRGGTSFMLHDRFGCAVDGVTISSYQVEFANRLARGRGASQVRFHFQNMLRTEFPDGHFTGIVTNETTMYVDLYDLFAEFARLLVPGGRYVAVTWCINDVVGTTSSEIQEIDRHYGCHMHRRSTYFAALAATGFVPYRVVDLTADAIPYWQLRTHSQHRTGIEAAFLNAYRGRAANFLLVGTEQVGNRNDRDPSLPPSGLS